MAPRTLGERLAAGATLRVLDVRNDGEWRSGHIEGAEHVMCGHLAQRLDAFRDGTPVAIVCGSGYRSTLAASLFARAGISDVVNVTGGMNAWRAAGLPVVS